MSLSRAGNFENKGSIELSTNFIRFTRSNFYLYQQDFTPENILNAERIVAEGNSDQTQFFALQLGLYYGFHKRQKKEAEHFFNIVLEKTRATFQATPNLNTKLAYATALSYVAHADSIDGGFRQTPLTQYLEVLKLIKEIETERARQTQDTAATHESDSMQEFDYECSTLKGFTQRYTAMMYHRQNFDATPEERLVCFTKAEEYIASALAIQNALLSLLEINKSEDQQKLSAINADLAESQHIRGVIFMAQNKLAAAMQAFEAAQVFWNKTLLQAHPFSFITQQSLGDLYRREKAFEKAEQCLLTALRGHEKYFKTLNAADVGKTMHFLGNLYEDMKLGALALYYYNLSLKIKTSLASAMLGVTEQALERVIKANEDVQADEFAKAKDALQQYPMFDWNFPSTFASYKQHLSAHIDNINYIARVMHLLNESEAKLLNTKILELATYYNHIERKPEFALRYLHLFNSENNQSKLSTNAAAWTQLHFAFSFQQLLAGANRANIAWQKTYFFDYAETLYGPFIREEITTQNLPILVSQPTTVERMKSIAFAWCLKALAEYELVNIKALQAGDQNALADLKKSADSYAIAIATYEKYHLQDNQYARAKNRYAQILAESPTPIAGHPAPMAVFTNLEEYWEENANTSNPYPARFYVSFGDALANSTLPGTMKLQRALLKYEKAVALLEAEDPAHPERNAGFISDIKAKISKINESIAQLSPRFLAAQAAEQKHPEVLEAVAANVLSQRPSI